jgi:hypothetical protein
MEFRQVAILVEGQTESAFVSEILAFVEMLPNPGERGSEIEQLLGPKLRAELERQRNWSEPPPEGDG